MNVHFEELKSVEAYDPIENKWSLMPSMIEGRFCHSSIARRNKLFVIGNCETSESNTCEVFDSNTKKFALLKQFPSTLTFNLNFIPYVFSVGSKLVTIGHESSTALCYDVEKNEWSEEMFNAKKHKHFLSCTFVPHIKF